MYVAVRRYEGVRDPQKVAQLGEESFVPIISEMPGFVAHYLVDAGDGVMVAVSVFEHKDAEEQSTFRAGEFVEEREPTLLPNPPQVTAGEVVNYKAKSS
jgi:carotenoid cleavage dioxygenase-like enzyme